MNVSFLQELLNTVAEQGRSLLPKSMRAASTKSSITDLAHGLVSGSGEASGVAIAREIQLRYRRLSAEDKLAFFRFAADEMRPDQEDVLRAAARYIAAPSDANLSALQDAVESPRQEFFRRLNLAPGATADIVAMRRDLLALPTLDPALKAVDADLKHLLGSWFNRGFLVLKRIDWQTPASILEKIMAYEAVHEIQGWDDLRRRLDQTDRRCFAFFHPSLLDEPLIFVEVALTAEVSGSIQSVLTEPRKQSPAAMSPGVAVFYSISNCQAGLKGISFGNFLIKQVVEDLAREIPSLTTYVTLSPVPGFGRWLDAALGDEDGTLIAEQDRVALQVLNDPDWYDDREGEEDVKATVMALAAHYFIEAKAGDGRPVDPVARFHLGNGARLERINWRGDLSPKGLRQARGLMVNYRYDLNEIEANHEAYANHGRIAVSRGVRGLLRSAEPASVMRGTTKRLAVPARLPGLATSEPDAKLEEQGEGSR